MTLSGEGPQLAASRRAGRWFRDLPAGFRADIATSHSGPATERTTLLPSLQQGEYCYVRNRVKAQDRPAEPTLDLPLEIAHLLLIDVVGYSKLLVNEQIELLHELNQIVHGTDAFRGAEASGAAYPLINRRRDGAPVFP